MNRLIVIVVTAVLAGFIFSSCNSLTVHREQKQIYTLDNGTTVYQYPVTYRDGANGNFFTNYDGASLEKRPIILHITGSGCDSNLYKAGDGGISGKSFGDFVKTAGEDFWIFTLEKRGVLPFEDHDQSNGYFDCSDEYGISDNVETRSKDNIDLLKWLVKQSFVDESKIATAGCSEGGYVSARIALESKIPTHIGSFSGVGPSQMYDFLIFTRGLWKSPNETPQKTEQRVSDLMDQYRDIFKNPSATNNGFLGHPYSKWIDNFKSSSLEDILKVKKPIFMANASGDESTPIESADFVEIEFIRHGKNNLTRKTYPGLDHAFRSCSSVLFKMTEHDGLQVENNPNCDPKSANKLPLVIVDFMSWINKT